MKGQSRIASFVESSVNILIGFWINFFANLWILPLFGFHVTMSQNFQIGAIYTVISIIRSYVIRRVSNQYHLKKQTGREVMANG